MFSIVKRLVTPKETKSTVETPKEDDSNKQPKVRGIIDHWGDSDEDEHDLVLEQLSNLKLGTTRIPVPKNVGTYRSKRESLDESDLSSSEEEASSPLEKTENSSPVVFRPAKLKVETLKVEVKPSMQSNSPQEVSTPTTIPKNSDFTTPTTLKTPTNPKYEKVQPKVPSHVIKKTTTPTTPSSRSHMISTPSPSKPFLPRPTLTSSARAKLSHKEKENSDKVEAV